MTCSSHDSYTNGPVPITLVGSVRSSALSFSVARDRNPGWALAVNDDACRKLASGFSNRTTAVYSSGVAVSM